MKHVFKSAIIIRLVSSVLSMLSPEILKGAVTALVDWVEVAVERSPNKYDDLLLPVIKSLRNALDLDNAEED